MFITFQRFLVVWWPLKYAKLCDRGKRKPATTAEHAPFRRLSSQMDSDWNSSSCRRGASYKCPPPKEKLKRTRTSLRKLLKPFVVPGELSLLTKKMSKN